MRCLYCHNADLVLSASSYPEIPQSELFDLLDKRKGVLDGVCVTGGEPMLQKDLPDLCAKIKERGFLVKIDTNGTFPSELRYIISEKLCDYVAMDIKNCAERYGETIGHPDFDVAPVLESVRILNSSGIDHEFRTTVCKTLHTLDNLKKIVDMIGKDTKYFLQAYRDSDKVMDRSVEGYTPDELRYIQSELLKINANVGLRGV